VRQDDVEAFGEDAVSVPSHAHRSSAVSAYFINASCGTVCIPIGHISNSGAAAAIAAAICGA
jgi:hypothetical protein